MIKVMIVDDVKILRDCLKLVIEQEPVFKVIGCAANGKEAIEMVAGTAPDIILMDLHMPVCSGHEAIVDIKQMNPNIKILVLTVKDDEQNMARAFKNGADGYVLKDISADDLTMVLDKTYRGDDFVIENAFSVGHGEARLKFNYNEEEIKLTERENDVLKLVMGGMTNEEISHVLKISAGRARNIVGGLISKCNVRNRTQLAVLATRYIDIDE